MTAREAKSLAENMASVRDIKITERTEKLGESLQSVEQILETAAKMFQSKSFGMAAKYFKKALDSFDKHDKRRQKQTVILTKYMLCTCWLQTSETQELFDALTILEDLMGYCGCAVPMIFYAAGRVCFKLYRFNKANELVKKGFATFRSNDVKFVAYYIPESDEIIPESTRVGLMTALRTLNEQCSIWRRPDAVCCLMSCSTIGHHEGENKNIFFGSPTFAGMVQTTCNNPSNVCIVNFHIACWKVKKEMQHSHCKISDKEMLNSECFTPNCIDGKGDHCIIKKIEIFDHEVSIKATIEVRDNDATRHVKSLQPSKGAIKKQQQQPSFSKIPSVSRTPPAKNSRLYKCNNEIRDVQKINAHEEEEDLNDEQVSKIDMEKLRELRISNFGMNGDKIWRPNLSMYGSEYMLATAGALPDPDFSDDTAESAEKSFMYSYFYDLVSNNGPMKLKQLEEKWRETQVDVFAKNCESILNRHADIADFLTQSLKIVIVGNYICAADSLPAAHDLAKIDASEILKFFMENDIDQNSTTSSLDDEAVFNDIIKQDMNNSALSASKDVIRVEQDLNFVSEVKMNGTKEHEEACTNRSDEGQMITTKEIDHVLESRTEMNIEDCGTSEMETIPIANAKKEMSEQQELEIKREISESSLETNELESLAIKNVEKRPHSPELSCDNAFAQWAEKNVVKVKSESFDDQYSDYEKENPSVSKMYGVYSVDNIENQLALACMNDKFSRKVKSTNDLVNHAPSLNSICDTSNNNSNVPDTHPVKTNKLLATTGDDVFEDGIHPARTNDTNGIIHQLTSEMGKMNKELTQSRDEINHLKFALAECQKSTVSSQNRLLKKLLQAQYNYNREKISAKLDRYRYKYSLIATIQQLLITTIGRLLPINDSEFTNCIAELEKISTIHDMKFVKLNEQLSSNCEKGIAEEVDLRADEIPNAERCDMHDIIRTAFDMFMTHQHFQNLQSNHHPVMFPPNLPINNPYYLPPMNATIPAHMQQPLNGPSLLPTPRPFFLIRCEPPPPPPPSPSSSSSSMQHAVPHVQTFMNFPPASKAMHATHGIPNSSMITHENPSNPDTGVPFSTPDESNLQSYKETKTRPVARTTPVMDTVLHQLDELSKKFNASQTADVELTTQPSCSGPLKDNNVEKTVEFLNENDDDIAMKSDKHLTTNLHENETLDNAAMNNEEKERKPKKMPGASIDRLMSRLKSHYFGVLELDLLKSIYCVRKKHNNALSKLSVRRIICEVDKFIAASQQKQLCGYTTSGSNDRLAFVVTPFKPCQYDDERKRVDSISSTTSSASLSKKKSTASIGTKKQWEPVNIPNDTWIKDGEETECVICFETMVNADCYTLNCKHSFHRKCISDWHKHQTDSKWVMGSCPLCRLHTQIDDEYPPLPLG